MSSNYATPSTSTSTPSNPLNQSDPTSVSSGQYFNSNRPPSQPQFAPPPPAAAAAPISNPARPVLPHASSSSGYSSNRMVFLEELNNQQQQATSGSGTGGGGGGGGGATFLSDEETNASGSGSTAFAPPPPHHPPPPPSNLSGSPNPAATNSIKGKGKAIEGSPPTTTGDETISATTTTTTTTSTTKKKPVKSKKQTQLGPDGKPIAPRERKKKAGRACAACQKAHLTCDDGRPCKRCIKKGCPDDCVDGARKKAKYLQEVPDELLERGRQGQGEGTPFSNNNGVQLLASPSAALVRPSQSPIPPSQSLPHSITQVPPATSAPPPVSSSSQQPPQPIFDFTTSTTSAAGPSASNTTTSFYDPTSFLHNFGSSSSNPDPSSSSGIDHTQFGSEAANLEYAILSSMLNGNGFALDAHTPNLSGGIGGGGVNNSFDPRFGGGNQNNGGGRATTASGEDVMLGGGGASVNDGKSTAQGDGENSTGGFGDFNQQKDADTEMFSNDAGNAGGGGSSATADRTTAQNLGSGVPGLMTAEEALRSVTKPYPYAQSYHFLVKHLKTRFEKNDILRIVRALATFRPSLIALQMPLTEEDETFVERTFQRTLVELHKLISFSGTPTVVWRRTGEICLVGTEFCLLTGWKREELVGTGNVNGVTTSGGGRAGGGKYIFELFDTASVVEYYESFAKHAFESTSTSVTLQCVVLGPDGRPVPCAFCFSVRRDLFSCPYLIIGSFLPILV